MGVRQDLVHLSDLAGRFLASRIPGIAVGDRVEAGEPAASRPPGLERRDAALESHVAAHFPAGEAPGLTRKIVKGRGERR